MDQKLKELKSEVRSLLEEYPDGINVNSFWGNYERKYGHNKLPDPKVFKVRKRSEIVDLCSDVCRRVGSGATALVLLKSSDQFNQQQSRASRVAEGAVGGKENDGVQPLTCKPLMPVGTMNTATRQLTSTQAEFSGGGGSFYDRFYSDGDSNTDSAARAHSGARTGTVANPTGHGSYSSLMGPFSRPTVVAPAPANPSASFLGIHAERFAVPRPQFSWNTPSPVVQHQQSPRSRDSSGSRSSDGARNQSPAPGIRNIRPQPMLIPALPLPADRPSGPGMLATRGRRTNLSREQLNSAAEDCIDRLSVARDYVSLEKISRLLCQDFGVTCLDELGLRQIDVLPCVNEHNRLECKVNAYIQNFVKVCYRQS